jgi:GNAT superfamily N-acetyltransferase
MTAALEVDAYPGFSSWDLDGEAVSIVGAPDDVVVAVEDDAVCGYVSPGHDDLTVHPEYRRRGHGRRLFAAGLELAAREGLSEIRLYVPLSGAGQAFARAMGMSYRSSMWRLDLAPEAAVPEPVFPVEVASRAFGDCSTPPSPAIPVPCLGPLAKSSMRTTSPISTRQRSCLSHLSADLMIRSPSFGPRLRRPGTVRRRRSATSG